MGAGKKLRNRRWGTPHASWSCLRRRAAALGQPAKLEVPVILVVTVVACLLVLAGTLLFLGRAYWAWVGPGAGILALLAALGYADSVAFVIAAVAFVAMAVIFGVPQIRQRLVSPAVMKLVKRALPRMSETERVALEAGSVWWDGEIFSGDPAWDRLLAFEAKQLSREERDFLDGPVEELCSMIHEWQIEREGDLPPEIWGFIKRHRFFGMIIPRSFGGLGFSAAAHSEVVTKIASRSVTAAVTVMVPNSLGPAELLLEYGTDEQKKHYLPRLAAGEEIPCFALTEPEAGSDAAAAQSVGVVAKGKFGDRHVLGIRLDWEKRYITLAPVATVIGLAFRLIDPDHLLGAEEDLGITVALIPADLPGIEIGQRHDPLGVPFQNGPTVGRSVFVPLDFIIGGRARAGQGWRMLMESLAAGRGISLPALSVGAAQLATRVVGAYGLIREQFNVPIGRFEGIEEPLARIGGRTYWMNAARTLTAAAIDSGEKPAVLTAIVKAYLTESMRAVVADAMDIRAGAGICRGPRNALASAHLAAPIGITVEGANILTRSLIIYGQGAIRCHRYLREEMDAATTGDVRRFDAAFFAHAGALARNVTRSLFGLSAISKATAASGPARAWSRELTRASCAFAVLSDATMLSLGGALKRREKISGRLADALAWLYLGSAVVKRFYDDGQPSQDLPFARWGVEHALAEVERALAGVIDHLPSRALAGLLRIIVLPIGSRRRPPSDAVGAQIAGELLEGGARERLTTQMYVPRPDEPGLGQLESALRSVVRAAPIEKKLRQLVREKKLDHLPAAQLAERARATGQISEEEHASLVEAEKSRREAIEVDAFDSAELAATTAHRRSVSTITPAARFARSQG
jgi:acyl-CoA dehydrogenase